MPFSESFQIGYQAFLKGNYFEAHEIWEIVWQSTPASLWEDKTFYQGCIQVAVALYHNANHNAVGARNLLKKAEARLESVLYKERFRFFQKHLIQAQQQIGGI